MADELWQELPGILGGLARSVAWSQARCDLAYWSSLETFRPVLMQARELGLGSLASQIVPDRYVFQEIELQVEIATRFTTAGGLAGMLVNCAYARRYEHAQTSRQRITMTVRSAPQTPGR
jgi:hypothetical protein